MALAEALHHSRDVGSEQHFALRGQKTASAAGNRLAPLVEVSGPEEAAVTVGNVAVAGSLGSAPCLQGDDGIDGRSIRYLLAVNLARKKQQEEEEEQERRQELAMAQLRQLFADGSPTGASSSSLSRGGGRRKKKPRYLKICTLFLLPFFLQFLFSV